MIMRTFGWLTEKESRFIVVYLTNGMERIDAARTAGYYGKDDRDLWSAGERVLQRPQVQKVMQEYLERVEKQLGITLEWKLGKLKKMVNTTAKDIKGNDEEVVLTDPRIALDSLDMLNKIQGHYAVQKVENTHIVEESETLKKLIEQHEKPY